MIEFIVVALLAGFAGGVLGTLVIIMALKWALDQ